VRLGFAWFVPMQYGRLRASTSTKFYLHRFARNSRTSVVYSLNHGPRSALPSVFQFKDLNTYKYATYIGRYYISLSNSKIVSVVFDFKFSYDAHAIKPQNRGLFFRYYYSFVIRSDSFSIIKSRYFINKRSVKELWI
jgi:hypothetical protein